MILVDININSRQKIQTIDYYVLQIFNNLRWYIQLLLRTLVPSRLAPMTAASWLLDKVDVPGIV